MLLGSCFIWQQCDTVWIHFLKVCSEARPLFFCWIRYLRVQLFDDARELVQFRSTREYRSSWYQFRQYTACRPNIYLFIVLRVSKTNFRRSVKLRDYFASILCWSSFTFGINVVLHKISRKTKICVFELSFCIDQYIFTLDISVYDSLLVHKD